MPPDQPSERLGMLCIALQGQGPDCATSEGDNAAKASITIFSPVHAVNCSCRFIVPANCAGKSEVPGETIGRRRCCCGGTTSPWCSRCLPRRQRIPTPATQQTSPGPLPASVQRLWEMPGPHFTWNVSPSSLGPVGSPAGGSAGRPAARSRVGMVHLETARWEEPTLCGSLLWIRRARLASAALSAQ